MTSPNAESGRVIPPKQCDIRGCALPATAVFYLPLSIGKERIDLCERHAYGVAHIGSKGTP